MYKIVLVILLLSLSACGFKLRGSVDLPLWLNNIAVFSEDGKTDLILPLTMQLKANKVAINTDSAKASYWLVLLHSSYFQQLTGIGASTSPRQYQLRYDVDFVLKTAQGIVKVPPSHLTVTRQLTINNDQILGSNDEANLILEEMRRDIAIQIVNKLGMLG